MRHFFRRLTAIFVLFALTGQGCSNAPSAETVRASRTVALNIWAVIDDVDVYTEVMNDYRRLHPNVQFNFRRVRLEEYESELLNALAEDRGPDVFLIHNTWVGKYLPKIQPEPASTKIAYRVVTGTIKQEETWQLRTEPTIKLRDFKDQFADAVSQDFVRTINVGTEDERKLEEHILGVPMSVDTLALYYNKDILNAAGIPSAAEGWIPFQAQVKKITKLDAQGNLLQSAAGMGTAFNVERAADILQILMIQNGTRMAADDGTPTFHQIPPDQFGTREFPPAFQATEFYTDFANPAKETYTWNAQQPNSLDAFIQGRTAFFFGYSYHLQQIRARAPRLNLGVTHLPQIEGNPTKNFANYWAWVVSKKSQVSDTAWNFLNFLAKPEEAKKVLARANRPAARKSLLADQLDGELGVFASQVLTAVSWYKGKDPRAMEDAFLTLINDVQTGAAPIERAVRFAADRVSQTLY